MQQKEYKGFNILQKMRGGGGKEKLNHVNIGSKNIKQEQQVIIFLLIILKLITLYLIHKGKRKYG